MTHWTIKHDKERQAQEIMQDQELLSMMSFLDFIVLEPTEFERKGHY